MTREEKKAKLLKYKTRKQRFIRITTQFFVWLGVAVIYYIGFSVFFDTPVEYELKHSTDMMRKEYDRLSARYDSLSLVLDNVIERDRNVFNILFESTPYELDSEFESERLALHERLLARSSRQLRRQLDSKVAEMQKKMAVLEESHEQLHREIEKCGKGLNNIPSIQPVINSQLTLLTAGYGTLMHPFYRTLQSHQGVDYTVPEGSSVFATADGIVKEVSGRNSTFGQNIVIDHGNGYLTQYCHLSASKVRKGQRVRRGDIIALSGNSGLSLSPHLHYEVRYEGMRVDPIHYFFMELTPDEYRRIIKISQSGMQSFD
ncbi:MAG TPA: M23 family metallopeptidase [Candidatus Alistipes excrementipullorum]|nr:M23 family metallopeptidase [Candidatus Alistipes excrementipullorum]